MNQCFFLGAPENFCIFKNQKQNEFWLKLQTLCCKESTVFISRIRSYLLCFPACVQPLVSVVWRYGLPKQEAVRAVVVGCFGVVDVFSRALVVNQSSAGLCICGIDPPQSVFWRVFFLTAIGKVRPSERDEDHRTRQESEVSGSEQTNDLFIDYSLLPFSLVGCLSFTVRI